MAARKELRTLSKRMEQQCTREVDSGLALTAEKEKCDQLQARVLVLEEEVRAKAQRLSEWENMTDKQKTAVSELEKLKKALTMQLMEQRSMLEAKDKLVAKTQEKLARNAKMQNEGVRQVGILQKEISAKARMYSAVQAELGRLKTSLQHREALLKGAATRVMSVLDSANEKEHWLSAKNQVEAIVVPILERERLDGLDPDEAATEQSRQRVKMQFDKEIRRKQQQQQQAAQGFSSSAPGMLGACFGAPATGGGVASFLGGAPRLQSLNTGGFDGTDRLYVGCGDGDAAFEDNADQEGHQPSELGGGQPSKAADTSAADGAASGMGTTIGTPAMSAEPVQADRLISAMTAAEGIRQQQQQAVRLPRSSSLPARDGVITATGSARRRPETRGTITGKPAASTAPGDIRGSLRSPWAVKKGGVTRAVRRSSSSCSRFKNTAVAGGGMRVLLPGEGARDYSSLLRGSEALRGRELEARVATAEAEATWLARENHRITVESERVIGARDVEAKRAVGALTAELHKARAAAAAAGGARAGLRDLETHNQATSFSDDVDHGSSSSSRAGLRTGGESSARNTAVSGSTVVAVRLPSPGNTVGYSENISLTAPTPFISGMSEEDELSSLPN
ncbi:hypothetical protein Esi_0051_0052 [Ectocarpus siliculosus]|uniref:Uncharacterized protein n=1 Tax=Ectocarpus siliculosus TaxID=2880 RepID=D7G3H1_ECTSI|nr:hypothetical protein Esi_0051_0052 [Ectocarpus siliculosus]|eukprot:CBJ26969.1 hypothetical protein Esi_0051_0052 [Ectocarpus siliculosus]